MSTNQRQRGLTLIELIMFIVIVGVALAGVLTVLNHTTQHSADPMIRKQALAIAEALLEEVMLQPFTWCDTDDSAAATATSYGGCGTPENNLAPDGAEPTNGDLRGTGLTPWDNVNDYHGLITTKNAGGGSSAKYSATVSVDNTVSLNGISGGAAMLITVTVTAPGETITLQGYRTRFAPNFPLTDMSEYK